MNLNDATVLMIDDDHGVRDALGRLLRSAGWKTELFASAEEFLERPHFDGVGCVLLDISMPGMTGPELHGWLRESDTSLPIIYLSGHCDVPTSVQAMKMGALDVIEKPADADSLLTGVSKAIEMHRQERKRRAVEVDIESRVQSLSKRERQVMDYVVTGKLNKQIAAQMGIAEKTVKVHRGRAMTKMKVRSVAELVHLCDQLKLTS